MSLYLGTTKISGVNVIFNDGAGSDVNETNIKTGITIMYMDKDMDRRIYLNNFI